MSGETKWQFTGKLPRTTPAIRERLATESFLEWLTAVRMQARCHGGDECPVPRFRLPIPLEVMMQYRLRQNMRGKTTCVGMYVAALMAVHQREAPHLSFDEWMDGRGKALVRWVPPHSPFTDGYRSMAQRGVCVEVPVMGIPRPLLTVTVTKGAYQASNWEVREVMTRFDRPHAFFDDDTFPGPRMRDYQHRTWDILPPQYRRSNNEWVDDYGARIREEPGTPWRGAYSGVVPGPTSGVVDYMRVRGRSRYEDASDWVVYEDEKSSFMLNPHTGESIRIARYRK